MLTITSVDRCATDLIISKHTLLVLAANMKLYKAENVTISSEHREDLSFTKADPAEFNF